MPLFGKLGDLFLGDLDPFRLVVADLVRPRLTVGVCRTMAQKVTRQVRDRAGQWSVDGLRVRKLPHPAHGRYRREGARRKAPALASRVCLAARRIPSLGSASPLVSNFRAVTASGSPVFERRTRRRRSSCAGWDESAVYA